MLKRLLLLALLLSMLVNIGFSVWILRTQLNFTEYCYQSGTFHYATSQDDPAIQTVNGPYRATCSDSPLPQTP